MYGCAGSSIRHSEQDHHDYYARLDMDLIGGLADEARSSGRLEITILRKIEMRSTGKLEQVRIDTYTMIVITTY